MWKKIRVVIGLAIAGKEYYKKLEELYRWRSEWHEYRRWFAEFEEISVTLDDLAISVRGHNPSPTSGWPTIVNSQYRGPSHLRWYLRSQRESQAQEKKTPKEKIMSKILEMQATNEYDFGAKQFLTIHFAMANINHSPQQTPDDVKIINRLTIKKTSAPEYLYFMLTLALVRKYGISEDEAVRITNEGNVVEYLFDLLQKDGTVNRMIAELNPEVVVVHTDSDGKEIEPTIH